MSQITCPRCQKSVDELTTIDQGIIDRIKETGGPAAGIPKQVCINCFTELAGSIARGSVLLAREKAKEQRKAILWKTRVNLIKNARQCMNQKSYAQAAVQYEKYIRVLEMVFEVKPGELKPENFKDSARTQELTVVASAFWDLIRIYDTSDQYNQRQTLATMKLAQFLRFTPIYPDILRKAEAFQKTARNPPAIKQFIKMASQNKGRCFIASSVYDSPSSTEVFILQNWRDQKLLTSSWIYYLNFIYYIFSPAIAYFLDRAPIFKPFVRKLIFPIVHFCDKNQKAISR